MLPVHQTLETTGGSDALLHASLRELVLLIRAGLPTTVVDELLAQGHLTLAELDRVVMPRKTLYHRRRLGRLTPEQSDRLLRVLRLLALAEDTFGSRDKAATWLRRPTRPLADDRPLDLLDTDADAHQVEELLPDDYVLLGIDTGELEPETGPLAAESIPYRLVF